jgi:hypothetical protein
MFAVRINPKTKSRPKTNRGEVWVKDSYHMYYVSIKERGLFDTEEEARQAITELWEIIVPVSTNS